MMSRNIEEVIFWIGRDGGIVVSDPSRELMPLFSELGCEIGENLPQRPENTPRFLKSRSINLPFSHQKLSTTPTEELRSLHQNILQQREVPRGKEDVSYLDLKAELCERIMESCSLCERRCGINRLEGKMGLCRAEYEARITREYIHMGEEKRLIPSYTIFFAGCNMKCVFCHELERNRYPSLWKSLTPLDIASLSLERCKQGDEVIVRHLPLPGHIECCTRPILHWVAEELRETEVSILEYQPPEHSEPPLDRALTNKEKQALISISKDLELKSMGI